MTTEVTGSPQPGFEEILTPAALQFLTALDGQFSE